MTAEAALYTTDWQTGVSSAGNFAIRDLVETARFRPSPLDEKKMGSGLNGLLPKSLICHFDLREKSILSFVVHT